MIGRFDEQSQYGDDKFTPVALSQTDRTKVMVVSFEPGQFIPVHSPNADLALIVMEGSGTVIAGDEESEAGPGTIAFAAAGEARGIRALTRMRVISVVSPPPNEADHAEVRAGLQRGTWKH